MKKSNVIATMNNAAIKSQTSGIANTVRNSLIEAVVTSTTSTVTMQVTSRCLNGVSYALTGNALSGHAKTAGLVASAVAGAYVGVKAGSVARHAIENYENDLLSRDASVGLEDEEEEDEPVADTEFKETDDPQPEQK